MFDFESLKNAFALIGIGYVSAKIVFYIATLYDQINLWGFKKGVQKWLAT